MNVYELNDMGKDWWWAADTEEEATKMYIEAVLFEGVSLQRYEEYCEEMAISSKIKWKKIS